MKCSKHAIFRKQIILRDIHEETLKNGHKGIVQHLFK